MLSLRTCVTSVPFYEYKRKIALLIIILRLLIYICTVGHSRRVFMVVARLNMYAKNSLTYTMDMNWDLNR